MGETINHVNGFDLCAQIARTEALGAVSVPFTVTDGTDDNLVTVRGGCRTAEAVPHARYVEVSGMGHNLPAPLWSLIDDDIAKTTASVAG